jgi:hypothetical protein
MARPAAAAAEGVSTLATNDEVVHIGDMIRLYSEEAGGIIFSEASVKARVTLRPGKLGDLNLPNNLGAAFQVMPVLKYKAAKRLAKLQRQAESADNEEETERLLKDAREHARAEREDDANELKRQMGKAITYGQVVQLRHVLTQYMLAASSTDAAELDVMNLDVSLSPETSRRPFSA